MSTSSESESFFRFLLKNYKTCLFILVVFFVIFAAFRHGIQQSYKSERDVTSEYMLPPKLADCTIHVLSHERGHVSNQLSVMRCPNSTTTTRTHYKKSNGSTGEISTTVIDGDSPGQVSSS